MNTNDQPKILHHFFDRTHKLTDSVFDVGSTRRVKQVHGIDIIAIDENFNQDDWREGDGIVTDLPNIPIGVITADCAPILLYGISNGKPVIGAAHAGWQGALNGIVESTLDAMACDAGTAQAYIGPCIARESYEVSKGFEKPFLDHNNVAIQFFTEKNDDKLLFDLKAYCAWRLRSCEVGNIEISDVDTLTNDNYHSHRGGADGTKGERNLSAVMIAG